MNPIDQQFDNYDNSLESDGYYADDSDGSLDILDSPVELATEEEVEEALSEHFRLTQEIPSTFPVARSGPAAVYPVQGRFDIEPLYRLDTRPPSEIMAAGFTAWNDTNPPSLRFFQLKQPQTAYISLSRNPQAALFMAQPVQEGNTRVGEDGRIVVPNVYQYEVFIRGGIDMIASLREAAYTTQQEVLIPDRIPSGNITRAWRLDANGGRQRRWVNNRASDGQAIEREWQAARVARAAAQAGRAQTGSSGSRSHRSRPGPNPPGDANRGHRTNHRGSR